MRGPLIKSIIIRNTDDQVLLVLPPHLCKNAPKQAMVEFEQPDLDTQILLLVDRRKPQHNKRYKLVHHAGSTWTSVPARWLRDRAAQPGDVIQVYEHADIPNAVVLDLQRAGQ